MTTSISSAKKILAAIAPAVFWLALWQLCAMGVGKELILPSPIAVIRRFFELCVHAAFWRTALTSLLRIFLGFAAGVLAGAMLAALTCASRAVDRLLSPVIRIVRATPVASFIILVLLWVTRALVPALMAALMVIPVVWAELATAIRETDSELLEMAAAYRFGRLRTLRLVYIPSVTPQFISACLTAQGLAWKSGIAAEVLCQPKSSIGTELYHSKLYLETPSLFAWTALIIVISFLVERLCRLLAARLRERKIRLSPAAISKTEHIRGETRLEGVSLSYGGRAVLNGLTLTLPEKGISCIMAPSGAGKTTLLHVLAGLLEPDSGKAETPEPVRIMFQEDRLLPWLTALENVQVVSDAEAAKSWLLAVGLEGSLDLKPAELSGGMSRRVALARALASGASLLLLDEPFSGLDEENTEICAGLIKALDIPVVVVTHSEKEISFLGGHRINLGGGL